MAEPFSFNINGEVRIRLTPHGRSILATLGGPVRAEDVDGWSKWQMWEVMQIFGPHLFFGGDLPFEAVIEIREVSHG